MADPKGLYSYQGGEPQPLPHEISYVEDWGGTNFRQGVESFTDEELAKAGYTGPYEIPSFDQEYQKVSWDSENFSFVVEDISEEVLWNIIRQQRNRLLSACDWTMAADAPETLNFHEWEMYRQRLRDITQNFESPKEVVWPISPEGRSDDDFDQPRVYENRIRMRIGNLEFMVERLKDEIIPPNGEV